MTESTAIEQPAGTLTDDLNEALAGFDDDMQPVDSADTTEEDVKEDRVDISYHQDESDYDIDVDEGSEDEGVEGKKSDPDIKAPTNWSDKDKSVFDNATPEVKQWLLDRHKSMESDYTRKSQEVAEIRKTWGSVHELFAPHIDYLRSNGQTPESVIKGWAQWDQALSNNPEQAIRSLAKNYGVNIGGQEEVSAVDPKVQSLEQQVLGLQQQIHQREQYEHAQRNKQTIHEIQSFADEKTESGNLAHPYFDDVIEDMRRLAEAERLSGRIPKIGELYESAIWAHPEVREKMLADRHQAAAKKAETEARAKAARAKKAQKTLRSSPDGDSVSELSLRDELEKSLFG